MLFVLYRLEFVRNSVKKILINYVIPSRKNSILIRIPEEEILLKRVQYEGGSKSFRTESITK